MITELVLGLAAVTASVVQRESKQPEPATCQAAEAKDCIQGVWTGRFATAGDWTFEFTRAGSGWTGRYRTPKGESWLPMVSLVVTGRTARFAIESKPQASFDLALSPSNDTLSGRVEIAGLTTIPFTAARSRQ